MQFAASLNGLAIEISAAGATIRRRIAHGRLRILCKLCALYRLGGKGVPSLLPAAVETVLLGMSTGHPLTAQALG
jgi:hypothetical protein